MPKIVITAETGCDIPAAEAAELGVTLVPMHVTIGDKTTLAAQTGVIGNIKDSGKVYCGSPALPHRTFLRAYAKFKKSGEE